MTTLNTDNLGEIKNNLNIGIEQTGLSIMIFCVHFFTLKYHDMTSRLVGVPSSTSLLGQRLKDG